MSNWAKDYLKYSNEAGGGESPRGSGRGNGPGCAGILFIIFFIWLIVDLFAKL